MGKNIREISLNLKKSMSDPRKKKSWQSGIGIAIFTLFVLSSVVISRNVQALNLAAGNYGYYGGTYGYNASDASSDYVPNPPTSLSSSVTQSTITFSWTAPTLTTGSTSLDNLSGYCYQYGTSSVSTCTLSDSTTSSASLAISTLACGTTEYIAVRAYDSNQNLSESALTGSATTTACAGAPVSGGTGTGPTGPTYPTAPTVAPAITVVPGISVTAPSVMADAAALVVQLGVTRSTASETANAAKVASSATEMKVTLSAEVITVATNFVTYGSSSTTMALGSGERLAVMRDVMETLGSVVAGNSSKLMTALEQISSGQKPTVRNLPNEQKQVPKVLTIFQKLTGKTKPNFKNTKEDMAWNTLQYRIRFSRDLNKEKAGIGKFKGLYGRNPKSPLDWAAVRAYGYALK